MSIYTIKMNDIKKGLETIIMEDAEEYHIGQTISISPRTPIWVLDQHGNSVTISPGASITGTVIDKRY